MSEQQDTRTELIEVPPHAAESGIGMVVARLVEVVEELRAEVDALRARIEALEGP